MLKVAKLSQEPEPSLILSSEKVNANDTADKSSSRTFVQTITQPKALTDLKSKKKKISPSSQPKSSYKVRVILTKTQVAETQHAEETVATADATKNLDTSESTKEQVNQPKIAEAEKGQRMAIIHFITNSPFQLTNLCRYKKKNIQEEVKEFGLESMKDITFDQIMDEIDQKNKDTKKAESPYDTESEIKIIKSFQATAAFSSLLIHQGSQKSTLDDLDVIYITPKDDEEGDAPDSLDYGLSFADKPAQLDPRSHLYEEVCTLNTKKKVTNDEPPVKKLKYLIPTSSSIPSPTPLKSIMPESLQKPDATKMIIDQFTKHLTKTTSSIFYPTPPREPTPPRDPTPLKDESKRKGIATEDPLKDIMPFKEEGGSAPKIPSFKSFVILEGLLT
nr:hypothetical protein [Tanacetum cinerariifolium]